MKFVSPWALLLGLLMSGQGLLQAFEDPTTDLTPAVVHFVVASVVAGIGLSIITGLVAAYSEGNRATARAAAESDGAEVDVDASGLRTVVLPTDSTSGPGNLVTG
jgi:hypothetical protein